MPLAALGESAWRGSGLGSPTNASTTHHHIARIGIDALQQKATTLEPQLVDVTAQRAARDDDLSATRNANRELMAQLNQSQAMISTDGPAAGGGRVTTEGRPLLAASHRSRPRAGLIQAAHVVVGAALGPLTERVNFGPTVGSDQPAAEFGGIDGRLIELISVAFAWLLPVPGVADFSGPRCCR